MLQESHALDEWASNERFVKNEALTFKISIQDRNTFPSLRFKAIEISAGSEHTIQVISL